MGSSHVFIDESAYLEHFGIPGMKWGRRKGKSSSSGSSRTKKTKFTRAPENADLRRIQKKRPSEMSNDELRRANDRLNLETQYRQLNSRDISSGKAWAKNTAILIGTTTIAAIATKYASKGSNYVDKAVKIGFNAAKNYAKNQIN